MKCAICGGKTFFRASRTKRGYWICPACFKKAGSFRGWMTVRKLPLNEIEKRIYETAAQTVGRRKKGPASAGIGTDDFVPTHIIGKNLMLIDERNKKIRFPKLSTKDSLRCSGGGAGRESDTFQFRDMIDYEVLEDDRPIVKGSLGGAMLGEMVFGEGGAVLGSMLFGPKTVERCGRLWIRIIVDDLNHPMVEIDLLKQRVSKKSRRYKRAVADADRVASALQIILMRNEQRENGMGEY